MVSTPGLTRSVSLPSQSSLGNETPRGKLTRSASLLEATTPILGAVEPQSPDGITSVPTILGTGGTESRQSKKSSKKSNRVSNDKKAKVHLASIAGAVTLGAVLAPFTGGLSLLPTVFVIMYGNASAITMYGGSEFVVGDKEKKKSESESPKHEDKPVLPPKHLFNAPAPTEPTHESEDVTDVTDVGGRGNTFNHCFNTNNYNSWYIFLDDQGGGLANSETEDMVNTPAESRADEGTQTTNVSLIDRASNSFTDINQVKVDKTLPHVSEKRLEDLRLKHQNSSDPNLAGLSHFLREGGGTADVQMVDIVGRDGVTAYALISTERQAAKGVTDTVATGVPTETQAAKVYTGKKWKVPIPVSVSLTNGAQAGSNYSPGPRYNLDSTHKRKVSNTEQAIGNQVETDTVVTGVPTETQAIKVYTGKKWKVPIPASVSLTNGAQTGSNYSPGPRYNLDSTHKRKGSNTEQAIGSQIDTDTVATVAPTETQAAKIQTDIKRGGPIPAPVSLTNGAQMGSNYSQGLRYNIGSMTTHMGGQTNVGNRGATRQVQTGEQRKVTPDNTTKNDITSDSGLAEGKNKVDLDKIGSRFIGKNGGHIQYKVPKFLDRPEAGTFMGSWRPIPEWLRGETDSFEFKEWRKNDLNAYLQSLNTKVLLSQGAVSMRGQNYLVGPMNNVRERVKERLQIIPKHRLPNYKEMAGLDFKTNSHLNKLARDNGSLIMYVPPVKIDNLVSLSFSSSSSQ
ncbi:hypothetical protein [Shewanella sp. YLB-07]|uniref:hypothetical protein n=1 Tax=Shewanella sp. YLB-07 TaxID=2601268 RepID=UPI00128C5741|nr:hypothetical protein [Shewanella sp. YLB-07]MPY23341.1 hypothetical protein [Shewanella sp. YLB-07]